MLSPDDFTQPIAPRTGARSNHQVNSAVDSKLETNGPGPKMVSLTLPAFGLICATILIGFACAFVIGRMTVTPVQAANVESIDSLPSPVADLSPLNGDPMALMPADSAPATTAPAAPAVTTVWGYQVMNYKGESCGLADKLKETLEVKGFDAVTVIQAKNSKGEDTAAVIVGGSPNIKTLEKTWKQKLTDKGYRADPVKFIPAAN